VWYRATLHAEAPGMLELLQWYLPPEGTDFINELKDTRLTDDLGGNIIDG
jgi:hypothetical protein